MALTNRDYKLTTHIRSTQDPNQENVFWYQAASGTTAIAVVSAFAGTVMPAIMGALSSDAEMFQIDVINMANTSDFATLAVNSVGLRGASVMPVFNVIGYTYLKPDRIVHDGKKSLGPLSEGDITNGAPTVGYQVVVDALATTFASSLSTGFTSIVPGIMKTVKVDAPGTKLGYRYVPSTFYPAVDVIYKKVTHLTSRPS